MKKFNLFLLLLFIAAVVLFTALFFGGSMISFHDSLSGLLNPNASDIASSIIWNIRMPRIFLGIVVGAGLAICGCIMQSIIRNPLADPYTLGVSGGAAFGAAVAIIFNFSQSSIYFIPVFSFLGTLLSMSIIYVIASLKHFSRSTLILTGVILGFFFSSLVLLIYSLSDPQKLHNTITWLMGDLSITSANLTIMALAVVVFGGVLTMLFARELDILTLGDEKAFQLGANIYTAKKVLFVTASLIVGTCVAVSGVIGFVGLVMPHLARSLVGPKHITLLPVSAFLGAAFLVLSDTVARTIIAPVELPVGVITGLVGGVFILYFLIRPNNRMM